MKGLTGMIEQKDCSLYTPNQTVGVIIPAFNEEKRIASTIRALKGISCINKILVVDDGSTDKTADVASKEGAHVIRFTKNKGKGYALKTGMENLECDILLFLDADLEFSAKEAIKLISPVLEDKAQVAIAKFSRNKGTGGVGLVKFISQLGVRVLTGKRFGSILSGQRGFVRNVMNDEFLKYKGFGIEFGMTVDLLNSGIKIHEVDVNMDHRNTKRDLEGFVHRGRQFMDIAVVFIKKLMQKAKI